MLMTKIITSWCFSRVWYVSEIGISSFDVSLKGFSFRIRLITSFFSNLPVLPPSTANQRKKYNHLWYVLVQAFRNTRLWGWKFKSRLHRYKIKFRDLINLTNLVHSTLSCFISKNSAIDDQKLLN